LGYSPLGLIVSVSFATLLIVGTAIAMGVGWHFKLEAQKDPGTGYRGTWQYFTDDTCTIANTPMLGPCWKGTGAGYEGYYWSFTCDNEFLIYESLCDVTNCTNCRAGRHWGEVANQCISYNEEVYRWICMI